MSNLDNNDINNNNELPKSDKIEDDNAIIEKFIIMIKRISYEPKLPLIGSSYTKSINMKRFTVLLNYSKESILDILQYNIKSLDLCIGCFFGLLIGNVSCLPYDSNKVRNHNADITDISHKFMYRLGQYSKGTSMALCIAESILAFKDFNRIDIRNRFHYWWYSSYCNCLESNQKDIENDIILKTSISEFVKNKNNYCNPSASNNNSSLIRLAPIVIFWRNSPEHVMMISQLQSFLTHGSEMASVMCALLSFILLKLLNLDVNLQRDSENFKLLLINILEDWLNIYETQLIVHPLRDKTDPGFIIEATSIMIQICESKPIDEINSNWNWKVDKIDYKKVIDERNLNYDNRIYTEETFGDFAPDALALALHIIYNSSDFSEIIYKTSIIGGNSSSIGCIACQIAGAYYGYNNIIKETSVMDWNRLLVQYDDNRTITNTILLYLLSN